MEIEEQDRHLEKVGETVGTLKILGQGIGRELDEQNVYGLIICQKSIPVADARLCCVYVKGMVKRK